MLFDASAIDEHVQGKISMTEDGQRQSVAVTETAVAGLILGKIQKAKCVKKFVAKIRNLKHGVIKKLAKGIKPVKGDVSAAEIGLNWEGPSLGNQGYAAVFENYVATLSEFKRFRLPKNFKTFDFWIEPNGRAVSVKTLDTNKASYLLNPNEVYNKIERYVDKTVGFTVGNRPKIVPLDATMIKTREIQLGIPANTGVAQWSQIQRAIDYGKLNNVEIVITRIGK